MRMTKEELLSALRLAAKGLPAHTAELVKEAATRLDATSVALCESLEQRKALTAENVGLNKFIKADCWLWDDKSEEYLDAADCMPETPATDRFVAEMKAQGVEMLGASAERLMSEFGDDSYKVMVTADLQRFASAFAKQLREVGQ